jgi:hypothetical protein
MKLLIKTPKWRKIGQGACGTYYKINATQGVKIVGYPRTSLESFKNINDDRTQIYVRAALREAELLTEAWKRTKLTPKCFGAIYVKMSEKHFYVGILQEHIKGIVLSKLYDEFVVPRHMMRWNNENVYFFNMRAFLENKLKEKGIHNNDINHSNIIVDLEGQTIKSLFIIDFDAYLCHLSSEENRCNDGCKWHATPKTKK